jgi:D-tyrosyl-tRNA(Tyr) deacylase
MRACIQRVSSASVSVDDEIVGQIEAGLVVLLGVASGDSQADAEFMAGKLVNLRIFCDEEGKMNLSLLDVGGEMLVVSQFTLLGDCRKGRRPSFVDAAQPDVANGLYESLVAHVQGKGVRVATGKFQAMMDVALVNDGPVTMLVDSRKLF